MARVWTRMTRKYLRVPVTARLADGSPAVLSGGDIALLAGQEGPDSSTTWTPMTWDGVAGVATILVAGPDVDPLGECRCPSGVLTSGSGRSTAPRWTTPSARASAWSADPTSPGCTSDGRVVQGSVLRPSRSR